MYNLLEDTRSERVKENNLIHDLLLMLSCENNEGKAFTFCFFEEVNFQGVTDNVRTVSLGQE